MEVGVGEIVLLEGDFIKLCEDIQPGSVSMIFTDPPYDRDSLHLFEDLAKVAAKLLKRGGHLITYYGQYALPDILQLMCPYIRFWWPMCVKNVGGNARFPGKFVFVSCKPLLWFVKEVRTDKEYVADLIVGEKPEKSVHRWAQGVSEAEYYIGKLTNPGDVVLDPMCGGGTTLVACHNVGRTGIGMDLDPAAFDAAWDRISQL
jgi:DNA modification methylase